MSVEAEGVASRRPWRTDFPCSSRSHRYLGIAAVVLVLLGGLEIGTRRIEMNLPVPLTWHSYEAQRKVEQLDRLAARGVDVVFLGTSMVNAGVIPSVFEAAAGGVTAYNAALSSGTPRLMEAWALNVVLPRVHPKVVVIGVTSVDLTDAGVAESAFFDAFRNSPAGREALGRETWSDRIDRWLGQHVALWKHRAELRNPMTVLEAIRASAPAQDPVAASMDPQGHLTNLDHQQFSQTHRSGIAGVSAWSLGTEEPNALRRLIAGVEAAGARPVLVEMPVTAEYIAAHPRGEVDYEAFKQAISGIATASSVPLIDLDRPRDHALFADELHLNRTGATRFSTALARALRDAGALATV